MPARFAHWQTPAPPQKPLWPAAPRGYSTGSVSVVQTRYSSAGPRVRGTGSQAGAGRLSSRISPDRSTATDPASWCEALYAWPGSDGDLGTPGLPNDGC